MKKISSILMAVFAVISILGCSKETDIGPIIGNFDISLSKITSSGVTVNVMAPDDMTYIVICTDNLEKGPTVIVEEEIDEIRQDASEGGTALEKHIFKGRTQTTFSGLDSGKTYRIIAMGIHHGGQVHGRPAELKFKTKDDSGQGTVEFRENPDWKIQAGSITDISVKVEVTAANTENYYFIDVYPMEDFLNYEGDLEEYIREAIEFFAENEKVTGNWHNCKYVYNEPVTETWEFLNPGTEYVCFAIGIDNDGNPTGLYAQTSFRTDKSTITASGDLESCVFTYMNGKEYRESSESFDFYIKCLSPNEISIQATPKSADIKYHYIDFIELSVFEDEKNGYDSDKELLQKEALANAISNHLPELGFEETFCVDEVTFTMGEALTEGTRFMAYSFEVKKEEADSESQENVRKYRPERGIARSIHAGRKGLHHNRMPRH